MFALLSTVGVLAGSTYGARVFLTGSETTVIVGGLGFVAAMLALRQRSGADRRDAWWKRAQWAIDLSTSSDPYTRRVGTDAMFVLIADTKATAADLDVLDAALTRALAR